LKDEAAIKYLQVLLNSMHKYQPVIRILEASNGIVGSEHIFYFIETQFYAVTAYQNEKVSYFRYNFVV